MFQRRDQRFLSPLAVQQGFTQVSHHLAGRLSRHTVAQGADHVLADVVESPGVEGRVGHHRQQLLQQQRLLVVVARDPQADTLGVFVKIETQPGEQRRVSVLIDVVLEHGGIEHRSRALGNTLAHFGGAEVDVGSPLGHTELIVLQKPDFLSVRLQCHHRQRGVIFCQGHQGHVLGNKFIGLRQVEGIGFDRPQPGGQLLIRNRTARIGRLVIGREAVSLHPHVGEGDQHIAGGNFTQQAVDHGLVVTVHDVGALQHILGGVFLHPRGQGGHIAHRVALLLEAEAVFRQAGLLVVQPLLRTFLAQHLHVGEKQLQHPLVVLHPALGQ